MKNNKNQIIHLAVALFATVFFYNKDLGMNALLFSSSLLVLSRPVDRKQTTPPPAWPAFAALLVSSVSLLIHGSALANVAYIFSLMYFAGTLFERTLSVPFAFACGLLEAMGGGIYRFGKMIFFPKEMNIEPKEKTAGTKFVPGMAVVMITLLFLMLYRNANAVYDGVVGKLDFGFLSFSSVMFFLLMLYLSLALFQQSGSELFYSIQKSFSDTTENHPVEDAEVERKTRILKAGFNLFVLLNLLILSVNITDIVFLWGGAELPEGVSYSQMVHQGVGSLIFSIILAITVILFVFTGKAKFLAESKAVKKLAYAWVAQNILMVASTALRNGLYVAEYDLTHKRIGVWFYLLLAIVGLVTTIIYIRQNKTLWYLIRVNSAALFTVLLTASLFHWDVIIARYNIKKALYTSAVPDIKYLTKLSPDVLPWLEYYSKSVAEPNIYTSQISQKKEKFLFDQRYPDFREYTIFSSITLKQLK